MEKVKEREREREIYIYIQRGRVVRFMSVIVLTLS